MGLGDAYQESTDTALRVMASRPIEPDVPKPKHSAWTTIPRAVTAAAAEVGGNLMDVADAYGQVSAAYGQNQLLPDTKQEHQQRIDAFDKLQSEGINWRTDESKQAYSFARDLRPDPLTAGTAENIFFGLTKGLTKAIGSGVMLGPVGGAATFGTSEGMTTAEDLAVQGVDQTTRTKVGATVGVLNAAGMALPVAGNTLAQTAALVAVGGPGSFMAQQLATRSILENANYHELAQQYDPLDPTGIALATLLPAGFAAWAKSGAIKAAMAGKQKAPEASGPAPTPEQIDALMVHNLTAARDAHESTDPATFIKVMEDTAKEVAPTINSRELGSQSLDNAKMQERPAVRADESGSLVEPAQLNDMAGSKGDTTAIHHDVQEAAFLAANKIQDEMRTDAVQRITTEIETSGGIDFSKIGKRSAAKISAEEVTGLERTKFGWTASVRGEEFTVGTQFNKKKAPQAIADAYAVKHAETDAAMIDPKTGELTEAGLAEIDRLTTEKANDQAAREFPSITELSDLDYAHHWVQFEAMKNILDSLGIEYSPDGGNSKYIQIGKLKIRFSDHENTARDVLTRMDDIGVHGKATLINVVPNQNRFTDALNAVLNQNQQKFGIDNITANPAHPDPHIASIIDRAETLKAQQPDMPVALREDGQPVRLADELDAIRRQAKEGTADELGAVDAPLVKVAAECFLAMGSAAA